MWRILIVLCFACKLSTFGQSVHETVDGASIKGKLGSPFGEIPFMAEKAG